MRLLYVVGNDKTFPTNQIKKQMANQIETNLLHLDWN